MDEVLKYLLGQGPFAIVALIAILMARKLYKDLMDERKACRDELKTLEERYIQKADSWVQQYHEQSKEQSALVNELAKISRLKREPRE